MCVQGPIDEEPTKNSSSEPANCETDKENTKPLKDDPSSTTTNTNVTSTDAVSAPVADLEWAKSAEDLLGDDNYKKHLIRQANRILLRLRQLFYIKHEIIGDEIAAKIDEETDDACEMVFSVASLPDLQIPDVPTDLPADWWDKACDTCMFLGVYKHGYEKYSLMRLDPRLCFLQLCGPPDAQDLLAEQQQQQDNEANDENNDVAASLDMDESAAGAPAAASAAANTPGKGGKRGGGAKKGRNASTTASNSNGYQKFPSVSELNNRLRRLIAAVQKYKKQEMLMSKRNAERQEKRMSKLASTQERAVMRQIEKQSKWSRREEQNFYRAVSSFGVDCVDKVNNVYAWERFKEIGN